MEQLGSYRLRKRLAVGGMGEVYLGEKIGPEGFVKPVVLKCVLPQLAKDRAFVHLFLDEARLAALLNHPNIAQVYDFGLVEGIYYIAMEYVPGYTVDDIRRKLKSIKQHMPLEHVACIASQVCQGLHYAHTLADASGDSLGLVHRDVSPHNLIVSVDGSVKIVDFGIAKARSGLTRVQAKGAVGKFGYMSPEQARGEHVDGRSDLFSLGICLWELSTNERLHEVELDKPPEYSPARPVQGVDTIRAELPRQMLQILETALAVEAEDRYPTAKDMHLALERFQAAMTHYAGQAALAGYIKDLVEGRVENPVPAAAGVVEPVSPNLRGPSYGRASPAAGGLEGARAYEEVFGVSMDNNRPRPRVRAVPSSWETKPKPKEILLTSRKVEGQQRVIDVQQGAFELEDEPLELMEIEPLRSSSGSSRTRRPDFVAQPSEGRGSWVTILLGLCVVLLGLAAVYVFQNQEYLISNLSNLTSSPKTVALSIYRIESTPAGAEVLLDGEHVEGTTPKELELMPGLSYEITIRRAGYATKTAVVKAASGGGVRSLPFMLEKAAILTIKTTPPGAFVTIDNWPVRHQETPMTLRDLPAGKVLKVTVEAVGFTSQSRQIKLRQGRPRTMLFKLKGR